MRRAVNRGLDILKQQILEALMNWYCVHIKDATFPGGEDEVFRKMLRHEYRRQGAHPDCSIYGVPGADDGRLYYFSRPAAALYGGLVEQWNGFACLRPRNLGNMTREV